MPTDYAFISERTLENIALIIVGEIFNGNSHSPTQHNLILRELNFKIF